MGAEKTSVKPGGFFHLFDWNKKSRKKLFANGNVSPEGAKQGRKQNNSVLMAPPRLIEDDDIKGPPSIKGSDYSCASSVTDEEGTGIRAPGVVARLMGLESLPTIGISGAEPYSTPLFDSRSLRENCYRKRGPEFHVDDNFSNVDVKSDCYARKPSELRPQKMPSSPIERFQTEVLPPRSAKSIPLTHYKLLSPIKNPGFISGKNAAHIMEAAARIIEPRLQANAKGKAPFIGPSTHSLEVQVSKESIAVPQRLSRLPESSGRPHESNAIKYLNGYSLNRSWNAPESCVSVKASPEWGEMSSNGAKSNGKTVSLAIQAKVNVQRREGSTTSSRSILIHREQDETKVNQPFKSQRSSKNKQQKSASTPGPSSVLKQNNQKQNCLANKDRITSKSAVSNQQVKKFPSGDANSRKSRTLNKIQAGFKAGCRKEDLQVTDFEKDGSSSRTKNVPRKKRLIDRNNQSDKKSFTGSILVNSHEKHVQSSVTIDEHQKWDEDSRRNGTDIISFTFTSPMMKSTTGSQSTDLSRKHDMGGVSVGMEGESNGAEVKNSRLSSLGPNMISSDALSILLELKLRELTSGHESSSANSETVCSTSTSVLYTGLSSASDNSHDLPVEYQEFTQRSCKVSLCNVPDNSFSVNDKLFNQSTKLQGVESTVECSSTDARADPEQKYQSPLSILEASFSSESCSSSDSSDSNNGSKACSSVEAQNYIGFSDGHPSGEAEVDLSDSASSICVDIASEEHALATSTVPTAISEQEMEYVRDILRSAGSGFEDTASSGSLSCSLDPRFFDVLENGKTGSRNRAEDKSHDGLWRKVLFDCVGECLESKRNRYFKAGCRAWAKGATVIGRVDKVADEICQEISSWKSMSDWMVDELVDKDMSSHLGRWVDFEVDAFEAAVEIEEALVSCLIDEVVADFIM